MSEQPPAAEPAVCRFDPACCDVDCIFKLQPWGEAIAASYLKLKASGIRPHAIFHNVDELQGRSAIAGLRVVASPELPASAYRIVGKEAYEELAAGRQTLRVDG